MNKLIWTLLACLCLTQAVAQTDFKLRKVHLYRDGAAMLEYSGMIATRQARFQMGLPQMSQTFGIHVRTDQREKLVNYQVHDIEIETREPFQNILELLKQNIGYQVTIEAFEGRESVGYSGEILQINESAEVLLLKAANTIEAIPIHAIQHITGGRALNTSKTSKRTEPTLSVYLIGDYNQLPLTVLVPVTGFVSDARYLLDFDKDKPEISLDLTVESPINLEEVDILYYNHAFIANAVASFTSQAAFLMTGVSILPNTRTTYQVLATAVALQLSDEVDVDAWEPENQALSMKSHGKRYLSLTNNSNMDWFSAGTYERKGISIGRIPGNLPEIPKKATAKMEYGPSPYVLTDNARLVKVKKRAVDLNGMKYDSYIYVGRIEIRNTSREAGRVRIIKHTVPDSRRNYWFANRFIDLKAKTKQEVFQLEYEVKVEANDVAFYSYRYELLIPSDN
jgi:hypothetical protein